MNTNEIATKEDIARVMDMLAEVARRLDAATVTRDESGWETIASYMARHGVVRSTVNRKIERGELEARGSGQTREVRKA